MRRLVLVLGAALLLASCRSGAGLESETGISPVAEGDALETAGALDEAHTLLEEGKALLDDDQCAAALTQVERAAELDPELPEAYLVLGNVYSRSGDSAAALSAYQKALELDADYAAAHTNLGAAYLSQATTMDDIDAAIAELKTAIEIEPDDAETHANLGSAYLQAQLLPLALDEFSRAIELDANLAEAYVGRGYYYLLTGEAAEGLNQLQNAVELDPEMPEARFALGIALAEAGQLDQAIATLEAFLSTEFPAGCAGDQAAAAEAQKQAITILEQLRGQ